MKWIFPFMWLSFSLYAQEPDKVDIIPIQLTDQIYMIKGSGGNMGLLAGEEGLLLIDDQFAPLSEKIMKAINDNISERPINYLINTHWHGDHTGGNKNFAEAGAVILAHKNVYKRLAEGRKVQAFRPAIPPAPKEALPRITFTNEMNLHFNGEAIMIFHSHNGHTDGDAIIYFPQGNVIHMGDTYFQGRFPYIDLASGGSLAKLIQSINSSLILIDDSTQIIPGHGNVSNRAELLVYRDMIADMYQRVKQSVEAGLSLEEVQAANLTKGYEDWSWGFITSEKFVKTIFDELTAEPH